MNDYSKIERLASFKFPKEYLEGHTSYPALNVDQNPYPENTTENQEWYAGWCDAQGYDDYLKGNIS